MESPDLFLSNEDMPKDFKKSKDRFDIKWDDGFDVIEQRPVGLQASRVRSSLKGSKSTASSQMIPENEGLLQPLVDKEESKAPQIEEEEVKVQDLLSTFCEKRQKMGTLTGRTQEQIELIASDDMRQIGSEVISAFSAEQLSQWYLCGYLTKKSKHLKMWKRRFVVVTKQPKSG